MSKKIVRKTVMCELSSLQDNYSDQTFFVLNFTSKDTVFDKLPEYGIKFLGQLFSVRVRAKLLPDYGSGPPLMMKNHRFY